MGNKPQKRKNNKINLEIGLDALQTRKPPNSIRPAAEKRNPDKQKHKSIHLFNKVCGEFFFFPPRLSTCFVVAVVVAILFAVDLRFRHFDVSSLDVPRGSTKTTTRATTAAQL